MTAPRVLPQIKTPLPFCFAFILEYKGYIAPTIPYLTRKAEREDDCDKAYKKLEVILELHQQFQKTDDPDKANRILLKLAEEIIKTIKHCGSSARKSQDEKSWLMSAAGFDSDSAQMFHAVRTALLKWLRALKPEAITHEIKSIKARIDAEWKGLVLSYDQAISIYTKPNEQTPSQQETFMKTVFELLDLHHTETIHHFAFYKVFPTSVVLKLSNYEKLIETYLPSGEKYNKDVPPVLNNSYYNLYRYIVLTGKRNENYNACLEAAKSKTRAFATGVQSNTKDLLDDTDNGHDSHIADQDIYQPGVPAQPRQGNAESSGDKDNTNENELQKLKKMFDDFQQQALQQPPSEVDIRRLIEEQTAKFRAELQAEVDKEKKRLADEAELRINAAIEAEKKRLAAELQKDELDKKVPVAAQPVSDVAIHVPPSQSTANQLGTDKISGLSGSLFNPQQQPPEPAKPLPVRPDNVTKTAWNKMNEQQRQAAANAAKEKGAIAQSPAGAGPK